MKTSFHVFFALLIGSALVFGKEGVDDLGLRNINSLPAKSSDLFQDIKTKYVKKETSFLPGFIQIAFATKATYKARYEKAAIHGGIKVETTVVLKGVSDEIMQEITDQAGAIYAEKLIAAGFEVVPRSALERNKGYAKILEGSEERGVETKIPALFRSTGTTHTRTFTANDGPIYSTKSAFHLYKMQKDLKAGNIVAQFTINFSTYKVEKDEEYTSEGLEKTISLEAIPKILMAGQSTWISSGSKFGMLNQNETWTVDKDFVIGLEEVEEGVLAIVVDPVAFKEGCLELIEKNIDLTVAHIRSQSK